jgi:hypothetical protein
MSHITPLQQSSQLQWIVHENSCVWLPCTTCCSFRVLLAAAFVCYLLQLSCITCCSFRVLLVAIRHLRLQYAVSTHIKPTKNTHIYTYKHTHVYKALTCCLPSCHESHLQLRFPSAYRAHKTDSNHNGQINHRPGLRFPSSYWTQTHDKQAS